MVFNSSGDGEKVKKLDRLVTKMAGFEKCYLVTGQTYSRKVDVECLNVLSSLGSTVHKVKGYLYFIFKKSIEYSIQNLPSERYHNNIFIFFLKLILVFIFRSAATFDCWQVWKKSMSHSKALKLDQVQCHTRGIQCDQKDVAA